MCPTKMRKTLPQWYCSLLKLAEMSMNLRYQSELSFPWKMGPEKLRARNGKFETDTINP